MSLSATDKDDIRAIFNEGFEMLILPQFDRLDLRMDGLEGRMDGLENHISSLEREFRDFKDETRTKLSVLEAKIERIETSAGERFDNVEEDVRMLYRLVDKLENGTKEEKMFAEKVIVENLPTIYKALQIIAKKHNIKLPA
ncbi:hypothetical protein JNM87_04400 [Candidatus Saccharibacteria bacterium]|nr:hypothetical protein [Candidatus Saccharibacteria bacterium]